MISSQQTIEQEIAEMSRKDLEAFAVTNYNLYKQCSRSFGQTISVPLANDLTPNQVRVLSYLAALHMRGISAIALFDLAGWILCDVSDLPIQSLVDRGFITCNNISVSLTNQISFVEIPNHVFIP